MANTVLDARGEACPIPVVRATQALAQMKEGTLEVHVDNEIAVQNLLRMAAGKQLEAAQQKIDEKHYVVSIGAAECSCCEQMPAQPAAPQGKTVVQISADVMGTGSDELGKVLLKGFVYALSQLPTPPDTVLMYNSGVRLAVEGSDSLDDLRQLAQAGTEIFACGTCLNYFGLTEKLAVGKVTNMYEIVEKLAQAGRIIRP